MEIESLPTSHNDQNAIEATSKTEDADEGGATAVKAHYATKWRFWAIMTALAVTNLLVAIDGTVVSTALPTIIHDLQGGELYVWVINAYFLTNTAFQPLYGQAANIFGRRPLMILAMAHFLLGSGICGGSTSMTMLIAGRAVQGIGGAALMVLSDIIVCDMVPLRERGMVVGFLFVFGIVGTSLGPFLGGIFVTSVSWRWVFFLNLPIGTLALVLLIIFLRVQHERDPNMIKNLRRIDVTGNVIFALSIVAIQIPLTDAGVTQPWNSWRTILPLTLGIAGLLVFVGFEFSPLSREPTLPRRLFANRTSATAFAMSFIGNFLLYWTLYFLPVYLQAVLGSTPTIAGVELLPLVVLMPIAAITAGAAMSKLGRYRPLHAVAFAFMTAGLGSFIRLDHTSNAGMWAGFQIIFAIGQGITMSTLLTAVQAPLAEADVATSASAIATLRSFATIVAIAVSTSLFNQRSASLAGSLITDPAVSSAFKSGHAYELATATFVDGLSKQHQLQTEVINVYMESLRLVWEVALGFSAVGFFLVFCEREIDMRTELDTNFGIKD